MANGGRLFVSKKELAIMEELKKKQQEINDKKEEAKRIAEKEVEEIRAMKKAYEESGNEALRLTAAMKERLAVADAEADKTEKKATQEKRLTEATKETASLEKALNKTIARSQGIKKKDAQIAKGALDALRNKFSTEKMTEDSFQSQAALLEDIASGSITSEEISKRQAELGDDISGSMTDYLEKSKKRLKTEEFSKKAMGEFDSVLGGMGGKIKGFITNPLTIATAALLTFNATQKAIGDQFGAIGVKEFRGDLAEASAEFTALGMSAADAQVTISAIANDFGVGVRESKELANNAARLAVSTATSKEDAGKLIGIFTQTQGLSGEQAENLLTSATALANANNVAPDKVLGDVAKSTEFFAKFSADGGENILKAAVQAKKLGLELSAIEKITSGLLNFQESLNAENEASIMIGRRLNFQKARELALANDVTGATAEVVKQLGSAEEFNKLNALQRQKLAAAAGLEVGELQKIVNKEKEALTLQGALSKQEIKPVPEEVLTQTAQLISNLQSIGITLAEVLGPPLNLVFGVFNGLVGLFKEGISVIEENILLFGTLTGALALYNAQALISFARAKGVAIAEAIRSAFSGFSGGGPIGIALKIAAATAAVGFISKMTKMKDGIIGPGGETIVSGNKGSVALDPQDSMFITAGTNLLGNGGGGSSTDTSKLEQKQDKQNELLTGMLNTLDGALGDGGRGLATKLAGGVTTGIDESAQA